MLLRSAERSIDLTDYSIDQNSTLVSGTFNNVQARSEPRASHSVTDFFQVDGKLTQEFSDRFKATLFGGYSKSVANTPHDTTIITDQYGLNGYRYNYGANPTAPLIVLPSAAANLANTYITEFRDSQSRISNNFWTAKLDAEYKLNEQLTIAVGGFYRRFGFGSQSGSRSSTFCAAFTCPAGQIGLPLTDALSDAYTVPGVDYAPAGTTLTYLFPNIGAVVDALDIYGRPLIASNSDTRSVTEKDSGAYFQFNVNSELFGLRYSANAGVRYVNTDQSSTGINNAQSVTINRRYDQFLPEFNLALYPSEKLIIRGAIAKVMRRPGLGDLSPGGSVNGFDYTISYGNPQLDPTIATTFDAAAEWYFDRGSLLSVAYFRKAINSFPIGNRYQGTYASTGLPASLIPATSPAGLDPAGPESRPWTISSTINGPGGLLQGVEVGAQLPFRFLPGPLKNLGFLGNVTYIDSNFTYAISRPAVSATTTSFPQLQPSSIETTFLGASKWSYNATLYYEDARFSLRGSLAYRDAYNTGTGSYGNILDLQASRLSLDVSSRLRINSHVELTAEAINLLNKPDLPYMDLESERTNYYHKTGRVFMAGARLKL